MILTSDEQALADAFAADDLPRIARLVRHLDRAHTARQARLNAPGALGEAAAWYASQGVAVFPCAPGAKAPITRRGFKDASTDVDVVRDWWHTTPDANIGLPTGRRFDVADIDSPAGLVLLYDKFIDPGRFPTILAVALTPHGRHLYIEPTGTGNRAGVIPGVDVRGAGGYVVAPPARTLDGRYRWAPARELRPENLPEAV